MGRPQTDHETGITRFWAWIFNCYLVPDGGDGLPLIVDPGLPALSVAAEAAADLAADRPIPAAATHGHTDHIGGIGALNAARPVRLHLPQRDADYLKGDVPRSPNLRAVARIWPVMRDVPFEPGAISGFVKGGRVAGFGSVGGYRMPVEPAEFLADGDVIPCAPDWQVIQSAGHTDDSICFYNVSTRTMFSGDTVLTCKGDVWFNPEYVDGGAMSATEDRLRGIRVDRLFPGHGRPVIGRDVLSGARPHSV